MGKRKGMEPVHTVSDLRQMQSLSLESKIRMSTYRINEWYNHWGGDVYVSFSGGKDSTVLLDLVRKVLGDWVPAVYVDTGLEYKSVRDHAMSVTGWAFYVKGKGYVAYSSNRDKYGILSVMEKGNKVIIEGLKALGFRQIRREKVTERCVKPEYQGYKYRVILEKDLQEAEE